MHMLSVIKTTLVVVAALTLIPSAYAGGTPKGKPFIQLGNQIIELQGQMEQTIQEQAEQLTTVVATAEKVVTLEGAVDSLEGRVDSLEGRVSTAEANLVLLNTKAANQQDQIAQLLSNALAHGVDILALQADLATVNQQIDILETEVGNHVDEIAALQAKATSLTALIETNALGLFALQGELTTTNNLIGALTTELVQLKSVLKEKQNIINHTCETGAFVSVTPTPEGGVVCGPAGGASGVVTYTAKKEYTFTNLVGQEHFFACPAGSAIASGTFVKAGNKNMSINRPGDNNDWYFLADGTGNAATFLLYLKCIKLLP